MISTKELAHVLTLLIHYLFRSVLSILDVESRFFHQTLGKVPNPAAFDTGLSNIWVYNLALTFVVPGSEIVAPPLSRLTAVEPTERNGVACAVATVQQPNNVNDRGPQLCFQLAKFSALCACSGTSCYYDDG